MRILNPDQPYKYTFVDPTTGTELDLFYDQPTASEIVRFQTKSFKRFGNKMIIDSEAAVQCAADKLIKIDDGQFGWVENGKLNTISSDPASENYKPDWKELLIKHASDVLYFFALAVLGGTNYNNGGSGDAIPLEQTFSGGTDNVPRKGEKPALPIIPMEKKDSE